MRHLVRVSDFEVENIISGKDKFLIRFFKKRVEFMGNLAVGDLVYLRRGNKVLGQFVTGKIVFIEGIDETFKLEIESFKLYFSQDEYRDLLVKNRFLLVLQINKVEKFITSPVEIPDSRKEWIVLDN